MEKVDRNETAILVRYVHNKEWCGVSDTLGLVQEGLAVERQPRCYYCKDREEKQLKVVCVVYECGSKDEPLFDGE